jgi:hypothetical protein
MSYVFVVDTNRKPLNPVHPGEARYLLNAGKAAVLKRFPFTIILKDAVDQPKIEPLRVKIDPGSRTTGIAVVNDSTGKVLFAAELSHRGRQYATHCSVVGSRVEEDAHAIPGIASPASRIAQGRKTGWPRR